MNTTELSHLARNLRRQARLTQYEVAEVLGYAQPSISRYESGLVTPPAHYLNALKNLTGGTASKTLINEELMSHVFTATLLYVDMTGMNIAPARLAKNILEIYKDAKENLDAGYHQDYEIAAMTSAKAILRSIAQK